MVLGAQGDLEVLGLQGTRCAGCRWALLSHQAWPRAMEGEQVSRCKQTA